jgi:NADH:ubiquinone oxidoreductase subunit 4 (subunit M)
LILALLLYIVLAIFFLRLWMNILFSSVSHYKNSIVQDVDKSEFLIFSFFLTLVFWLGNTWQTFIF